MFQHQNSAESEGGGGGRNYLFGKIYKFMELQYKEKGIRIDHKFDQVLLILWIRITRPNWIVNKQHPRVIISNY